MPKAFFIALGLASGIFGLYARRTMLELGFTTGFGAALLLLGGAAGAYATAQLLFYGLLQIALPTRSKTVAYAEAFSHAPIVLMTPYALGVQIDWSNAYMVRLEPLVYFGAFLAFHAFLKLATLFAALEGEVGRRAISIPYTASVVGTLFIALIGLSAWTGVAEKRWPQAGAGEEYRRAGREYAFARTLPEGTSYTHPISAYAGQAVTVRFALPDDANVKKVYATVTLEGDSTKTYSSSRTLRADGWTEFHVSNAYMPENVRECTIRWTSSGEPSWYRTLGIRPIVYREGPNGARRPPREILMSGPFEDAEQTGDGAPNVVLVMVDGLAARYMSLLGYDKETTPSMDRLGVYALVFPNATSPSADIVAATASVLTGLPPEKHNLSKTHRFGISGNLPSLVRVLNEAHYETIAITEGEQLGDHDMVTETGIERDFNVFDPSYSGVEMTPATSEGLPEARTASAVTLDKLHSWLAAHKNVRFFAFVRLRELENFAHPEIYGPGFLEDGALPRPVDTYESALLYLDRRLGAIVKYIRDQETLQNTCVIVASPYGHTFSLGRGGELQREPTLRVPFIVSVPGVEKVRRLDKVVLEQLAPTIAQIAGAPTSAWPGTRSLLAQ